MIRIDDSLLEELGLLTLPKEERDALLRQIYETLEMRVGMKLADRMSEDQLTEFERFIDGDSIYIQNYLNSNFPNWLQSPEYQSALTSANESAAKTGSSVNETAVQSEFAALRWLETNFPDYKQVVAGELDILKAEIKRDAGHIAQTVQQDTPANSEPQQFQPPQQNWQPPAQSENTYDPSDNGQQPPMAA